MKNEEELNFNSYVYGTTIRIRIGIDRLGEFDEVARELRDIGEKKEEISSYPTLKSILSASKMYMP
ncbi:hypothetical protein [Neobacillus cucumis]|uniref:hypothetical protein n=1 Tax=Neobacillus cucumis TaxID=1740721 RepID=UPI002E24BFEF|nr:hypothetical protein [Neobacillus cucumis]